jgi:peptidoglycan/LPS O-acetylase OafA/YrhL
MTLSSGSRVASVDGLRGLLAALVTVEHFPYLHAQTIFAVPSRLAVMIFFAMSGYVLTRAWDGDLPIFLVRRFVRLWPLYALCLFVGGAAIHHAPPWTYYVWWRVPDDAGYIHGDPAAWSLFIEAWAMPLMPLIVWSGRSSTRAAIGAAIFLAAARYNLDAIYFTMFIAGSYFSTSDFRVSLLESAIPQLLGKVSYSLYLTHCIVYAAVDHYLASPITPALLIPTCLVTAQIAWFLVENPSIQASRRVAKALESPIGDP